MNQVTITYTHGDQPPPTHLPGQRVTFTSDAPIPKLNSFADFLDWLGSNPNFIAMIIAALMALIAAGNQGPERKTTN